MKQPSLLASVETSLFILGSLAAFLWRQKSSRPREAGDDGVGTQAEQKGPVQGERGAQQSALGRPADRPGTAAPQQGWASEGHRAHPSAPHRQASKTANCRGQTWAFPARAVPTPALLGSQTEPAAHPGLLLRRFPPLTRELATACCGIAEYFWGVGEVASSRTGPRGLTNPNGEEGHWHHRSFG